MAVATCTKSSSWSIFCGFYLHARMLCGRGSYTPQNRNWGLFHTQVHICSSRGWWCVAKHAGNVHDERRLITFVYLPYFWNSQSLLSNGHTCRVLSHLEMQWKWKAWLQIPHATVHSSLVAEAWLAWHSIHKSIMWFLQIAQLSTTMSHAHKATAFHFFTSNFFLLSFPPLVEELGASSTSTSAMNVCVVGNLCILDEKSELPSLTKARHDPPHYIFRY